MTRTLSAAIVLAVLTWGSRAEAQVQPLTDAAQQTATAPATDATAQGADQPAAGAPAEEESDDAVLNRSQPDFTLINLPTGLRLPKWKSAFRVTHRFTRALGEGDFGDLACGRLRPRFGRDHRPRVPHGHRARGADRPAPHE